MPVTKQLGTKERSAAEFVPDHPTLASLKNAVQECRGCDLYAYATQAVLGEGAKTARLVLIGEQPGDQEDLQGRPFVGPAGRVIDRALEEIGILRDEVYITNAVKHFKFEERGKRRIHKKPGAGEVRACRPWLDAELSIVRPHVIGCLGATASQAIFGNEFRLTKDRGRPIEVSGYGIAVATIHPSAILRVPDHDRREAEYRQFVDDLTVMRKLMEAKK